MRKFLSASILSLLCIGTLSLPSSVSAATTPSATGTVTRNTGLVFDSDHIANVRAGTGNSVSARIVLASVINFILFFLGLLTTAMIIYGGFLYITAGGDDSKTEKGKNIMIFSAIGIVIIFISFALVNTLLTIARPDSSGDPQTVGAGVLKGTPADLNGTAP